MRHADKSLVGPLYAVTMAKQKNDKRTCSTCANMKRPRSPLVGTGIGGNPSPNVCIEGTRRARTLSQLGKQRTNFYDATGALG